MSNVKKMVKISEKELINLIDNIVTEAVQLKKKEWLAEGIAKGDKMAILEAKILELDSKISNSIK